MAGKSLFDHVNAIFTQPHDYYDKLSDADRKSFGSYMINRFLSMAPQYLDLVNLFQTYYIPGLTDNRATWLFYSYAIPKKKQFHKYIKKTKGEEYESWLIDLLVKHFQVSTRQAEEYLEIYYSTKERKEELKQLCEMYGVDQKRMKKL